ncbi:MULTISPECIES: zinc ABC transporter substrate-binding protein [Pediococcus]|uniref:metal ABC transporter solute-binding protein, Zn/Mn family n=2 Tax=Lactobacillaceae TaxID=33958 RepID=UPI000AC32819|nr:MULTISPECIES: zinc ABC transporter substrate-binding protein [Pediococcus]GEL90464.1 metal ABC transporter substrate-binding protein [Pediococcus parvulus]GHC12861.1 metal ABC transporter substrate-binding protein [Pediococcus parvulus]
MKHKWLYVLAVLTGMCLLVLGGCAPSKNKSNKLHIVTSLNFYGETAKAVVGKYGTVDEIINGPNVDPHDFEPTTNTAKSVAKADVIVYNGLGYDSWMQRLIESDSESGATKINVGGTVMGKKLTDNPHVWYNHQTMPKLAQKLAKVFAKKDPKHRKQFEKNAARYIKSLNRIDKQIAQLKKNRLKSRVDVSEPVFDYALAKLGYKVNNSHFALAVENGSDPTTQDIRQMQNDIKKHKIAFFVNNPQASDPIVKNMVKLAYKHHVPVLNITETQPSGKTYLDWMTEQYDQVAKIQKKERLQ